MKRILTTLAQKWPEYLLEILVITIGILGAFALNNWNETNQNDRVHKKTVEGLLYEFKENEGQIEFIIKKNTDGLTACQKILEISNAEIPKWTLLEMDSLLHKHANIYTFDPINGAVRAAISTGNITLIQSDELSQLLYSWEDVVKDANEEEARVVNNYFRELDFFEKYVSYQKIYQPVSSEAVAMSNYQGLLAEPLLANKLTNRYVDFKDLLGELESIRKINTRILTLLEKEIQLHDREL